MNNRPLRYCATFDSFPASLPCVARFHANKVLRFRDALLTSYHRNEVNAHIYTGLVLTIILLYLFCIMIGLM